MKALVGILLAFGLIFIFGCSGGSPQQEPLQPLPAAPQEPIAPTAPQEPASPEAQPSLPPEPQSPPSIPETAPPPNPTENQSAPVPVDNGTLIEPEALQPISIAKVIRMGESIDFGEGKLKLDDIYALHQDEPALVTLFYKDGTVNRSSQMFPFSEYSFTSKTGTRYWIATGNTQAGQTIFLKRAEFYIFTARDNDTRFDKSLYADIIGKRNPISASPSALLGAELSRGLLNKTYNLTHANLTIRLDDVDSYPQEGRPALLSIHGAGGPIAMVELKPGQAYVAANSSGDLLAILNEASVLDKSGAPLASIVLHKAAGQAEENRTYSVSFPASSKPSAGYKIGHFQLEGVIPVATEKYFSVGLYPNQPDDISKSGAVLEIYDEDMVVVSRGFAKKDRPLSFTDIYGRTYQFWLDSASTASAEVSLYREA